MWICEYFVCVDRTSLLSSEYKSYETVVEINTDIVTLETYAGSQVL